MKQLHTKTSAIVGTGLYVSESVKKGETIGYINGPIEVVRSFSKKLSVKSMNWIGVGRYSWINTEHSPYRFINHSCEPNTAIVTKRKVIAVRDIKANSELTLDYSLNEADPDWSIDCCCKKSSCRKTIGPIYTLPKSVIQKYINHLAPNFKKIYEVTAK